MTASIVRVNGGIIKESLHRKNLIRFLRESVAPKILVVSTLPEIYNLLNESIDQVFYSGAESEYIEEQLHNFWKEHIGSNISTQYMVEAGKLTNCTERDIPYRRLFTSSEGCMF
jgi:hypothetical protein